MANNCTLQFHCNFDFREQQQYYKIQNDDKLKLRYRIMYINLNNEYMAEIVIIIKIIITKIMIINSLLTLLAVKN